MYGDRRQVYGSRDSEPSGPANGPKTPKIDPHDGYAVRGRRPRNADPGDIESNGRADARERDHDEMLRLCGPLDLGD